MANHLNSMRCYLAGPIDYAEDDGIGWRNDISDFLEDLGVYIFNPCKKPVADAIYKEVEEEKTKMLGLKQSHRYLELSQRMKEVVHFDLRMVDVSDFVIVYVNPDIPTFGTIHELINSLNQRKPTLVVLEGGKANCPNWLFGIMNFNFIFEDFKDLKDYLIQINKGHVDADLSRWVFFE
ncbi:MAG: hypothetical protein HOE36_07525 [Flavobacteriaceae bacterium]|jgi:nucleoside 2-deoxyribosyltransferase|nr:hypothetical protein [Flavobacteriaceae bacterium]